MRTAQRLTRNRFGESPSSPGWDRQFPAEEVAIAAGAGPGEEREDDGFRLGDIFPALGVVEVAAEPHEGVEAEAGFGDAVNDVGGFGRLVGVPVVGDGFGDAAEPDDGEFAGEPALEER